MNTTVMNLQARPHTAGTLMRWIDSRQGAAQRADLVPQIQAEHASTSGLTAEQLMQTLGIGFGSASGAAVTADTAMRVAAVYACGNLLSGAVASQGLEQPPLHRIRRLEYLQFDPYWKPFLYKLGQASGRSVACWGTKYEPCTAMTTSRSRTQRPA